MDTYYKSDLNTSIALTGGYDSRTNLAFANKSKKFSTYTYGIKGCRDLNIASQISRLTNTTNHQIIFMISL